MKANRVSVFTLGLLGGASSAIAADLRVPQEFPTIQAAVDAAVSGDLVLIGAGLFDESVVVTGKSLTIQGAGSGATIWRAPKGQRALALGSSAVESLAVLDIGFTGGSVDDNGSVVDLEGVGAKQVRRCRFFSNGGRAALEVLGTGSVVEDCLFDRNQLGLSIAWGQSMAVRRCSFFENELLNGGQGGPWVPSDMDIYACTLDADGCVFQRGSSVGGAPIRCVADATFQNCLFESGSGGIAGAIHSYYGSSVVRYSSSRFCGGAAPLFGGSGQFVDQGGNSMSADCGPLELRVPSSFATIQLAIDLCSPGDVVRLAPGVYTESCTVQGKPALIRGAARGGTTWIAPPSASCLRNPQTDSSALEISDIRFTGGTLGYGQGVVDLLGTGLKSVRRCDFVDNGGWAALSVFGDGSRLEQCRFERNRLGASLAWGQNMVVTGCVFLDNHQSDPAGAGGGPWVPSDLDAYACSVAIDSSEFENGSSIGGAPIRIYATADFDGCAFKSGQGGKASAIHAYDHVAVVRLANSAFCESPEPRLFGTAQFVDLGGNSVRQLCGPACPADIEPDGVVNGADMTVVLGAWGTDGAGQPGADVNGDGTVGAADLTLVLNAWGQCPQ